MTDAYSAMKNLVPVFTAAELPEKLFEIDESAEFALEITDASFEWETSPPLPSDTKPGKRTKNAASSAAQEKAETQGPPSRIEDINLKVPRKQLLCVVGSVG